ncbi:helix-turn-helix domain-containing protein [Colwellia piezophila]|uniref:helix-turn-helix domain-containing protein n=1 Tax=Colwellia piezophila TaxID=211668 RepID=UPI00036E7F10|nr:helix-turn-helix transcriptional regulator [Colwellia piezophila]
MKMLLDKHRLITERQQRAWSQTQLAEISGLSLRTIQRIEKNGKASLESVKALASVYSLHITDLRIINSDEVSLPDNTQPIMVNFCFLSLPAKILTTTVFILSTLVFLFMLWTNIPPAWINELRSAIFSNQLSASILNMISTSIVILLTLTMATLIGVLFDAIRDEGVYHYIKYYIQSGKLSIPRSYDKTQQVIIAYGKFLAKPLIISSIIVLISVVGIYLNMEDYQKNNMARFLQKF